MTLAAERELWLHAHCDDAALEILFAHDPRIRIIWAHCGFSTPPPKIARYFERNPGPVGELSHRDDVTDGGKLAPAWRALFTAWPERFLLGSATSCLIRSPPRSPAATESGCFRLADGAHARRAAPAPSRRSRILLLPLDPMLSR